MYLPRTEVIRRNFENYLSESYHQVFQRIIRNEGIKPNDQQKMEPRRNLDNGREHGTSSQSMKTPKDAKVISRNSK